MQEWNAAGKYWPSGAGGGGGGPELAWKEESGLDRWGGLRLKADILAES